MTPEQSAFLELAKQLRKTGAVKVEQTMPGAFSVVWATVPAAEKTAPVDGVPAPVTSRPPKRAKKDEPKRLTEEEAALKQLREELE